jgi:hypothetical protein
MPETIRSFLARTPFVPFRVYVSDQASYDVMNPHMCSQGASAVFIGIARRDSSSPIWDEPVIIANRHITRVEPLVDEVA